MDATDCLVTTQELSFSREKNNNRLLEYLNYMVDMIKKGNSRYLQNPSSWMIDYEQSNKIVPGNSSQGRKRPKVKRAS